MIKIGDNKILRNLEEQVQYLTDYHAVNQGLVQWGIRVVGQVQTEQELPDPYEGEYGDAIAVGTKAPYSFYIWTRPSIEGNPAYWFPFGEISIVGPQGPKGDPGVKGATGESTKWIVGASAPTNINYNISDMYLNQRTGDVYQLLSTNDGGKRWLSIGNIKGAQGNQGLQGPRGEQGEQGPQGEKGETGDVGGFINIWGTLTSTDQLPNPTTLGNLTVAYLVFHAGNAGDDPNDHYDLYIQVGATSAEANWFNAGPFNAATLVTVNGVGQNVWSADTKVDKNTSGGNKLYASRNNIDAMLAYTDSAVNSTIPVRNSNANFKVKAPVDESECANKKYVDDKFATAGGIKLYRHRMDVYATITATGGESWFTIEFISTDDQIHEIIGYHVEGDPDSIYYDYSIPEWIYGTTDSQGRILYWYDDIPGQHIMGSSSYAYGAFSEWTITAIENYRVIPYDQYN